MENSTKPLTTENVSLKTKISWGAGGLADNYIMNMLTPHILIMPLYNIKFGMNPALIGIALAIPRVIDAITDPVMGNISDNTRTRWGRRVPYIFMGAILSAMILPLLWTPPIKTDWFMFGYLATLASLYSIAYTIFSVPYTALGYELTTDYNERTKVLAWRMYIGLFGSLTIPWLLRISMLDIFGGNIMTGALCVCSLISVIIIVSGIAPAVFCKEKTFTLKQEKISLLKASKYTLKNRAFMTIMFALMIILCAMFTCPMLSFYINAYHIFNDMKEAATMLGLGGVVMTACSYISMWLITFVSTHKGKRFAMNLGLGLVIFGVASLYYTLNPKWPYLQLVSSAIAGLGMQGCWLMLSSMTADVCDDDEMRTGLRREGLYGAVYGFVMKLSLAISAFTSGWILNVSGFDIKIAEVTNTVPIGIITHMKLLLIGIQCLGLSIAMILILFYPLTKKRCEEIRAILDKTHPNEDVK